MRAVTEGAVAQRRSVEAKFEQLFEAAPDAMVGVDRAGHIRAVNQQTERLFGYDRDELIGQPIEILVPETFRHVHPGHRARYFSDPVIRPMGAGLDLSGRRKDGTEFAVDISLSSIQTDDGLLVIAAVRDITERRTIEQEFEGLLEAAPDAMVGVDLSGVIRFANLQTERLFGYDRDELIGQPIEILVPETFRDIHPGHRARYSTDPVIRPMGAGLDLSGRRKDGSKFPVDISLSSMEGGQGFRVIAAVRDITERRKSDDALHRLTAIIESSDDAIFSKTLDGMITSWNTGAERLYGYSVSEAVGQFVSILIPPGHHDEMPEILRRIGNGERVFHYETTRQRRDGRPIDVSLTVSPVRDSRGVIVGASTIARDISDRKRAEQALRQSEATVRALNADLEARVEARTAELREAVDELESFSYSVSHDLRAPLRAIDGFSKVLLDEHVEHLDDEGRRVLGVIRNSTRLMSELIDDLLEFSRVGRLQLRVSEIDMDALTASVVRDLDAVTLGRDVEIRAHPLPAAFGDRVLIRQVLFNLMSNAVKFTQPRQHARVEVGSRVEGEDNLFWIRDNGVGFDPQYGDKLFHVFQRLHSAEFEGTGVGLAIVQRIVHRHGGQVFAEGSPDLGATFYFSLPSHPGRRP